MLTQEFLKPAIGAFLMVALVIAFSLASHGQGLKLVRRWAKDHGFVLVSARRKSFVPHWATASSKGYQFFQVTIRDTQNRLRKGWIRCPEYTNAEPQNVSVVWED